MIQWCCFTIGFRLPDVGLSPTVWIMFERRPKGSYARASTIMTLPTDIILFERLWRVNKPPNYGLEFMGTSGLYNYTFGQRV